MFLLLSHLLGFCLLVLCSLLSFLLWNSLWLVEFFLTLLCFFLIVKIEISWFLWEIYNLYIYKFLLSDFVCHGCELSWWNLCANGGWIIQDQQCLWVGEFDYWQNDATFAKVEIISLAHTNSGNDFIVKFYINICHWIGHVTLNSFQLGSWLNEFSLS